MWKRKKIFASIDVGPQEVRAMVAEKRGSKINLISQETFSIENLALLGQKLLENTPSEIVLILPRERLLVKELILPKVDKKKIKSMLYYELAGEIPFPINQVQMDYLLLAKEKKGYRVKAFIIPEECQREIELLRRAGIEITRVIPRGLAGLGMAKECGRDNSLIQVPGWQENLVVFAQEKDYMYQSFARQVEITDEKIQDSLAVEELSGVQGQPWVMEDWTDVLLGAIYFHQLYPKFNLLQIFEKDQSPKNFKIAIGFVLILILLANGGALYLQYQMKADELKQYQTRMEALLPRKAEVEELSAKMHEMEEQYNHLVQIYDERQDYLVYLRELHILLQEDTEVNILSLKDLELQELHGQAPSATRVTARLGDSTYFTSPVFSSPITASKNEDIEEFSIRAELEVLQEGGEADE